MCQGAASVLVRRMARSAALTNLSNISQCFHCVLRDTPPLQRIVLERLEALPLRRLAQVHPELHDDRAIVGQRPLEGGDLIEQRVELRGGESAAPPGRGSARNTRRSETSRGGRAEAGRASSATAAAVRAPRSTVACTRASRSSAGSIHSFSRLTVSPFPAVSTPANRTMTGNDAWRSSCCTASSSDRRSRDLGFVVALRELSSDFSGFEHGAPSVPISRRGRTVDAVRTTMYVP